ncbi:hypothetical protein [Nafulsella turpanensis]|uniref:hypothetical protein n=1 Tax=Nafulsella turpanensis TaxID=1265690 RepID=UPI000346ADB2|nr:hypothetical protein [Nafulsella turpanensis]
MAEIKVEKKDKSSIWPWIIGIIVLLGIIWFLIEAFGEEEPALEEVEVEEVGDASLFQPEHSPQALVIDSFYEV